MCYGPLSRGSDVPYFEANLSCACNPSDLQRQHPATGGDPGQLPELRDPHAMAEGMRDGLPYPLPEVGAIDLSAYHALHCRRKVADAGNESALEGMAKVHVQHCAAQLAPVEAHINESGLAVPAAVCLALFPAGEEPTIDYEELGQAYRNGSELPADPVLAWQVLKGRNFGALIHKEHEGTLTDVERGYMDAWLSPAAVGAAAVALACDTQDPTVTSAWMLSARAMTFDVYF